jgi:hypothetical protein
MKNIVLVMSLVSSLSILAMESVKKIQDYSQEALVATRLAWAFQENRLGQLKYEAQHIAANHVVDYMNGNTYVAAIDARNQTITTKIGSDTYVTLSYENFSSLLRNETIVQLANETLQKKNQ